MYLTRAAGFVLMTLFASGAAAPAYAVERPSGFAVTNNYEHDADAVIIGAGDSEAPMPFEEKIASNAANFDHSRDGVCFYEHADYQGEQVCAYPGTEMHDLKQLDDRISSIDLVGDAYAKVCRDINEYVAYCRVIRQDMPGMHDDFDDAISYLKVFVGDTTVADRRRTRMPQGVCFYEHENFEGLHYCAKPHRGNVRLGELANKVSSIELWGDVKTRVCTIFGRDPNGRCETFSESMTHMREEWHDWIISYGVSAANTDSLDADGRRLRVHQGPDGRFQYLLDQQDPGEGTDDRRQAGMSGGACFYEHENFEGDRVCVNPGIHADLPPAFDNVISSIRVMEGVAVKVCEDAGGVGACSFVFIDTPSLTYMPIMTPIRGGSLDEKISSFAVGGEGSRDDLMIWHEWQRITERGHREAEETLASTDPNRVCFFEGADFQGLLECAVPGEAKFSLPDFDNLITSIEVKGEARVWICEHSGYGGWCEMIERDVKRIGDRWNNAVSSYQVVMDGMDSNDGAGSSVGTGDRQQASAGGEVCFYEDPGFQGRRVCVAPGARANIPPEFNDKISSIQLWGKVRVKVCKQSNESGACLVTSRSMHDMSAGFGDEISSFQISQEYTAPPGEIGERDQVCFYADEGFQGLLACANPGDSLDLPPELNNRISSISMPADVMVMVCDQSAYVPPCLTLAGEAAFLDDEWNNVISYYSVSRKRHQ